MNLIAKPSEMIINREVGITFDDRRGVFGITNSKGYLLPLKLQIFEFLRRNNRIQEMLQNNRKFSTTNNIHLAASLRSNYIKSYGNGQCFKELVNCLLDLFYDGLEFEIENDFVKVKFLLGLNIGDNLAMNAILEYTPSFRSKFFCRLCMLTRAETEKICMEVLAKLRDEDNYNESLQINNVKETGVEGDCIFNQLSYYHCTRNKSLDLMHDHFEGIDNYVLCQSLLLFIEKKYFTLKELNQLISDFDYGADEIKYIPGIFTSDRLNSGKLGITARESWQFMRLLPLCIGHKIPEDEKAWKLIFTHIEIIEMALGSSFAEATLAKLQHLISIFCVLYQELFGGLKPKMDLMTHLPSSIRAMGPPRHLCVSRWKWNIAFTKFILM